MLNLSGTQIQTGPHFRSRDLLRSNYNQGPGHFALFPTYGLSVHLPSPPPTQCWCWFIQSKSSIPTLFWGRRVRQVISWRHQLASSVGILLNVPRTFGQDCRCIDGYSTMFVGLLVPASCLHAGNEFNKPLRWLNNWFLFPHFLSTVFIAIISVSCLGNINRELKQRRRRRRGRRLVKHEIIFYQHN